MAASTAYTCQYLKVGSVVTVSGRVDIDPTGAGDTFAGGFMGYMASQEKLDEAAMRRAMIFGSVMASFNVEEFGTERVQRLTYDEINERFRAFKQMSLWSTPPILVVQLKRFIHQKPDKWGNGGGISRGHRTPPS